MYITLIDYKKAFDSLNHNYMYEALKVQGIPKTYRTIIEALYKETKARIKTDVIGEYFKIERGVAQGDPLSPVLFNCALEPIFRKLDWEGKGININGKKLSNLRFADDVILLSNSEEELKDMMEELIEKGEESGLEMSDLKTIKMGSQKFELEIMISTSEIKTVDEATYLEQQISLTNRTEKEIEIRISKAWKKFWSLKNIFKGPFQKSQKSEIFNMCVVPTLVYGSQTWPLSEKSISKIKTTQNAMERVILNFKKKDHKKITDIKKALKDNIDMVRYIRRQKWSWAGHVARMRDDRWTFRATFWFLSHLKRKIGRQPMRWFDDIHYTNF